MNANAALLLAANAAAMGLDDTAAAALLASLLADPARRHYALVALVATSKMPLGS